jgi:hypothetical protein
MVFNATFNNISVISWQSVLLVEAVLHDEIKPVNGTSILLRGNHGRDCMVVGFTTTYAISVYHH